MGVQSVWLEERSQRQSISSISLMVSGSAHGGGQRLSDDGLQRRQRYRPGFFEVVDGDGDGNGASGACRVGGGYGYAVSSGYFMV